MPHEAIPRQGDERSERGHLMAGVMVLLAIMLIFSTVVFQSWDEVLRRDNEAEMIFRAQDIVRAIVRFRQDRGTSPLKLEDLMEPGQRGQYFLRKLYRDPLVADGKWGMLYAGPGGEIIDPNAETFVEGEGALDVFGAQALSGRTKNLDRNSRADLARRRRAGRNRRGVDPRRTGRDPFATRASVGGTGIESEVAGGRQLAGVPVAGIKSLGTDDPFRISKGHREYSQWLFTYLDLEQPQVPGGPRGGPGAVRGGGPRGAPGAIPPNRGGRGRGGFGGGSRSRGGGNRPGRGGR